MRKLNTKASLTLAFGVLAAIASFSAASSFGLPIVALDAMKMGSLP